MKIEKFLKGIALTDGRISWTKKTRTYTKQDLVKKTLHLAWKTC